jgi:hypothetical protein
MPTSYDLDPSAPRHAVMAGTSPAMAGESARSTVGINHGNSRLTLVLSIGHLPACDYRDDCVIA